MTVYDLRILIKQVHSRRFANTAAALRRIAEKGGVADENRGNNTKISPGPQRTAHVVDGCVLLEQAIGDGNRHIGCIQPTAGEDDAVVAEDDMVQQQPARFVGVEAAALVGVVVFDDDVLDGGLGVIGEQNTAAAVGCVAAEADVAPADITAAEGEAGDNNVVVNRRPGDSQHPLSAQRLNNGRGAADPSQADGAAQGQALVINTGRHNDRIARTGKVNTVLNRTAINTNRVVDGIGRSNKTKNEDKRQYWQYYNSD